MRYDGHLEFTHLVAQGQSLSGILHHYQSMGYPVRRWEPIYLLTQRRTRLWIDKRPPKQHDNPSLIYPGDLLVFPRSPAGYDRALRRIHELIRDVRRERSEVQRIKKEAEEYGEKIDLISDVAQLVATCGLSAVSSLREAKGAVGVVAKLKLANAHGLGKEIGEKLIEFVGGKGSKHFFGETGEQAHKAAWSGKKAVGVYEATRMAEKARKAVEAIGGGVLIILDWISPSMLAKAYTHFDREIERAGKMERSTHEALLRMLVDKAHQLAQERHAISSSS
jgi:hypothetical protein